MSFRFQLWFMIYDRVFSLQNLTQKSSIQNTCGVSAACTSPGIWRRCRPACPAADWVCLTGRWCRPSRHTAACTPSGPHQTPSCIPAARHPSWSPGTRCRGEWGRRRRRRLIIIWRNPVSVTCAALTHFDCFGAGRSHCRTLGVRPHVSTGELHITSLRFFVRLRALCTFGPVLSLCRSATRRTRRASKD